MQKLPRLAIKYADCAILAATGNSLAIWAVCHTQYEFFSLGFFFCLHSGTMLGFLLCYHCFAMAAMTGQCRELRTLLFIVSSPGPVEMELVKMIAMSRKSMSLGAILGEVSTPGTCRSCSFWAFSQFQMAMLCELPPAAAIVRVSAVGCILICQVSEGGVSMTAFVLPSFKFHTRMKLSKELEAAYVPLLSDVTEMTPSVWPAG